jgi:hypothetical protein
MTAVMCSPFEMLRFQAARRVLPLMYEVLSGTWLLPLLLYYRGQMWESGYVVVPTGPSSSCLNITLQVDPKVG